MKHRVLLVVTFLASLVLLATSLWGCGITPLEAEPTYEIDTVVVPSATATRAATAPPVLSTVTVAPSEPTVPPATATATAMITTVYTPDPAVLNAQDYGGWQTYENASYGFGLRYPEGWTLSEVTNPVNTMAGHRIDLVQDLDPGNKMYIAFRFADEDRQILPTGMSQGECQERGSILFLGEELGRQALVDRGDDSAILYGGGGEVVRGELVFWLTALRVASSDADRAIPQEVQEIADAVLHSVWLSPG